MSLPSATERIIAFIDAGKVDNYTHASDLSVDQACDKINTIVNDYLKEADLQSPDSLNLLKKLSSRILINLNITSPFFTPKLEKTFQRCKQLEKTIEYIQKNKIPNSYIVKGERPEVKAPTAPDKVTYANVVLDSSNTSDDACIIEAIDTLHENIPLIVSSRTLQGALKKEPSILNEKWWMFQNKQQNLILCLPKELASSSAQALQNMGYNQAELEELSLSDLNAKLNSQSGLTDEEYSKGLAREFPRLLSTDGSFKRRFNFIGHGFSTGKLAAPEKEDTQGRFAGMSIEASRKLIQQIQGLQYANFITCFGAGRNLTEVFSGFKRNYTVSVCSTTDFSVLAALPGNDSNLAVSLRKRGQFWQKINETFERMGQQGTISSKDLQEALEHIYGYSLSSLPVVS